MITGVTLILLTNLTALSNGPMQATDSTAGTASQRTYRVTVRTP